MIRIDRIVLLRIRLCVIGESRFSDRLSVVRMKENLLICVRLVEMVSVVEFG